VRLFAFILALLLLAGSVDPTRGWLITLVVVTGLAAIRPRFWNWFHVRPVVDLRLAAFVLAVLLLAGTIDPTRDWLIALSVVTGLAMCMPRMMAFDLFRADRDDDRAWRWQRRAERWSQRADRGWERWERRMDRRRMRHTDGWGDDWS
jgi:outer membrane murein-binding lipoprotein Lpp